ncbi:MAG: ArgE/DapE family deacylase [Actinomycetota bacterium]|nr:ArgE/DapE family deacylase [Actinomycetota bacterium]
MTERTGCSRIERRVIDAIDEDQIGADLVELVGFPSVDGTAAEAEVQGWCAERLRALGMTVDHWDADVRELAEDPAYPGMEVERNEVWGCVGRTGRADRQEVPALVLNGHVDVVPVGDLDLWPDHAPFTARLAGGAWWGRGTCDMKGGVAAILGAVDALTRAGVRLVRPLAVHTVIGEEDGGIGTLATLRRGHTGAACVIAEPTDGAIVPANAGSLTFSLTVTGLATHGSTRTRGVSALEKFELVHRALRRLEAERNADLPDLFSHLDLGWPLSVGQVSAGGWASTVPDRLVAQGRYGVMPGESVQGAKAAFNLAVAQACLADPWLREHPAWVEWPGGLYASASLPEGHPLLDQVTEAIDDVGGPRPGVVGGPYGSDLRHYAMAGVPTLQYGPGDIRFAHAVDEHVPVADVLGCARAYAVLAVRLCGVRE